jgi:hypothetical protein
MGRLLGFEAARCGNMRVHSVICATGRANFLPSPRTRSASLNVAPVRARCGSLGGAMAVLAIRRIAGEHEFRLGLR